MAKVYMVLAGQGGVQFEPYIGDFPQQVLENNFVPQAADQDLELACRLGDPELLHCVAFRRKKSHGGVFAVYDGFGVLYGAIAQSNLDYAAALGYFGSITANARYGQDIFEEMAESDV